MSSQRGGRDAPDATFDAFARRYSGTLLHSAYLLTADRGQAEDVMQMTLLRTARNWATAHRGPEAYARRVLINLSRDRYRSLRRRVGEDPLDDHAELAGTVDHADGVIDRDALIGALRSLPTRQREVVVLRFFADLTIPDTAAAIGATEGTVKSHTSRALARLRTLLAEDPMTMTAPTNEVSGAE